MSDVYAQDPSATLDWSMDWADQLAANGNATITNATVTCPNVAAAITSPTWTTSKVTWRLAVSAAPIGTTLTLTVHVTLSTGEQDERDMIIHVRNT